MLATESFNSVIQAPIIEEAMKGVFLFFMLTGPRRREMHTLVDHLVYAGFVGFGFAYVENLIYFASSESLQSTLFMTVVRTGFNLFGHSFYTSATAVGIYLTDCLRYDRDNTEVIKPQKVIETLWEMTE